MHQLEFNMNQTEWVLWDSFLKTVAPMLDALGEKRAKAYVNRLSKDLKTKTAIMVMHEHNALQSHDDRKNPASC